jgi:ribonucleoside-diphosphate reductase subunit M1
MRIAFEDKQALEVNELIHETIYHAAMETSMELAREFGHYETFPGSPLSKG